MDAQTPRSDHTAATLPPARTDDVDGLTAADVMHGEVDGLSPSLTVGELRAWFAVSRSRRLAVLAADGRYLAAFTPTDVPADAAADRPAVDFATHHPTVRPETTARAARDLVVASGARRLPVVDDAGTLIGVVAVTTDLQFFACRPQPAPD
jgi:CBS domain-containing protein